MNNTDKLIDYLISNIESAKGFVAEQAPDVARQILEYGFWDNLMYLTIGAVLFTLFFIIFVRIYLSKEMSGEEKFGIGFFVLLAIFFCSLAISFNVSSLIKIKTAPKLYVIEKMKELK